MRRGDLRAARANRVFCADKKRIRKENTVMVNTNLSAGVYTRSQHRNKGWARLKSQRTNGV
jgi:hypothetical protein